jgi:hypothetical protein
MKGGCTQSGGSPPDDEFIHGDYDPEEDDELPPGWTREILDTAEEEAFFREDPDGKTLQLVIPISALEKEALENAAFVETEDPAMEVAKIPNCEKTLPPPVPETDPYKPPPMSYDIKVPSHEILPPVDPAIALPTLPLNEKVALYERSVVPRQRRYVKFVKKSKGRRRRSR